MKTGSFWTRVDEHLDAGRDPLDDAAIESHLSTHPELLDEFASLTHAIRALSDSAVNLAGSSAGTAARSRPRRIAGIAAAALLGSFTLWIAWGPRAAPEPELIFPDFASEGEVIGYSTRTYRTGPQGRVDHEIETGTLTILERQIVTITQPGVTTPHGFAIRIETSHRQSRVRTRITEQP